MSVIVPAVKLCEAREAMNCPSCGQRKGRRDCPALRSRICPTCCGTKRLVEINCPETCSYLQSAREHPAAVVKRQQQRDAALLLPTVGHLTERQRQLFFLLHATIARHKPEPLSRLIDDDVAEAAAAVASTAETAARGVLYEHTPASLTAQRLARELTAAIGEIRQQGAKIYDGELAIALRAIERGARDVQKETGDNTGYLSVIGRLLHVRSQQPPGEPAAPQHSIIIP